VVFSSEDQAKIEEFWQGRALGQQTRWTSSEMTSYESKVILALAEKFERVLDLGCGDGSLSRFIQRSCGSKLTAVDIVKENQRFFSLDQEQFFIHQKATEYHSAQKFDLVLAFGLIPYLSDSQESELYKNVAGMLAKDGYFLVKNQNSNLSQTKIFTGFSPSLGSHYVAKYPSVSEQSSRLSEHFSKVRLVPHPAKFNLHADTRFNLLICGAPRV
jgi:cyclopropane fatty-acyl-phospholipid synthase-like methyltransferase